MTNGKDRSDKCKKNKRDKKKTELEKSLQDEENRLSYSGYEAARRKRFNEHIELLRLELELDACPKVKIVESATEYIKRCKLLQQCIFQDDIGEEEQFIEKKESESNDDTNSKLRKKLSFYMRLLEEAKVTVELKKQSKRICATFPVLQSSTDNVILKNEKKVYDMFFNVLENEVSESIVSKNVTTQFESVESKNADTQCEKCYFDFLASNESLKESTAANITDCNMIALDNTLKVDASNIEGIAENCLPNGHFIVGDIKPGFITLVTQSPSQGPIMSTGRNGTLLKTTNPNSLILLSNNRSQNSAASVQTIVSPYKVLKKIAPKPQTLVTQESEATKDIETETRSNFCKRKVSWKDKKEFKMTKLNNKVNENNDHISKSTFDNDDTLQEICPSTLNALVRNATISEVEENQALVNLMDFSCITNEERDIDTDNTLDADENLVDILCSIADNKSIDTSSKDYSNPQSYTSDHTSLNVDNKKTDMEPIVDDISDKNNELNQDSSESAALEPSIAKSNYSVMSLCMPSKIGKASSPTMLQTDTCNATTSQQKFNSIINDGNMSIQKESLLQTEDLTTTTLITSTKDATTTFDSIVTTSSLDIESTTCPLSLGTISHTYPFPNISISSIGNASVTTTPFITNAVSHSISRISCPTANVVAKASKQKAKVIPAFAETKVSDGQVYCSRSTGSTLTQTKPTTSISGTGTSTTATCISSSMFSLSTMPSYSRTFGFHPLSITEAPTTFSFTLTTQSSPASIAAQTSVGISLPYSESGIVSNRTSEEKMDATKLSLVHNSNVPLSSKKVKSPEDASTPSKVAFSHREAISTIETLFNPINALVTSGQTTIAESSTDSFVAPLFRTPLKSDGIAATSKGMCWPLTSYSIEYDSSPSDLPLTHSITYSSCTLSSVSSVFSSSTLLSSAPNAVGVSSEDKSGSAILSKSEKLSIDKKKTDVAIAARDITINDKVITEEKSDCGRTVCKDIVTPAEFRILPHLQLSCYPNSLPKTSSDSVEKESKFRETLPINVKEKDNIDESCSKPFSKNLHDNITSNAVATTDQPNELSKESETSKSKETIISESTYSSPEKEKSYYRLLITNDDAHGKESMEVEPTKPNELTVSKNSSKAFCSTGETEHQIDNLNIGIDVPPLCAKEKFNANRHYSEAQKYTHHLPVEGRASFVPTNIPLSDSCRLSSQATKPVDQIMSPINILTVSNRIASEQTALDKNPYRKGITCPTTDISFSVPKDNFGLDTSFLTQDTNVNMDSKMEDIKSQTKATVLQDKEKKIEKYENSLKKCQESKVITSDKISDRFNILSSNDAVDSSRSNIPLKLCDHISHMDVSHSQSTHQLSASINSIRNSEVISTVAKTQHDSQMIPFPNVCSSVPIQNIHSITVPISKSQQEPDQLLMACSESVKKSNHSSPNSHSNQFEQQALIAHSLNHHESQPQQSVPSLTQQQSTVLQNNLPADIIGLYQGMERESIKGSSSASNVSGYSNVQTFDSNPYYRKSANFARLDTRYNYHGYKQFPLANNDFLSDTIAFPNQPPSFSEGNDELVGRGLEISSSEHLRGFSVSHLVSQSNDGRKSLQKDHTASEEKTKESQKVKSAGKKSDAKGRGVSTASKNTEARQRGQGRTGANFASCVNNKCQQKNIPNYSTEAILSSQNYIRQNHRQPINQNYHFIPPNQMYQPSYSSQQVKNLSQNVPFSYSNHDRSGPPMHCNPDYNFQLHPQASTSLTPYGSNMPYMAASYPYQNITPSTSSMIPSDIMSAHHAGAYRLPDIPDQSNFHSNASFPLPTDAQELCPGNVIGSAQPTMTARMSDPGFGISGIPTMPYRNSTNKNTGHQNQSAGLAKRSKYFDPGMITSGVTTPTNFLDSSSVTHIPIHSFTPPCEDSSALVPSNLLGGSSRHQNNFLIGHESAMSMNGVQYQDVNVNLSNPHLIMPSVSKVGHAPQIFSSNSTVRSDRQLNIPASHLSSSLSNFNLTSIIPEIDAKHDGSSSAMVSGSSRQLSTMDSDPISMTAYNRLPNMGANFASASTIMKENAPQLDANNRFVPVNSVNNIFTHSHQVGLNLNSGLSVPTSTFSGMNFQPGDH